MKFWSEVLEFMWIVVTYWQSYATAGIVGALVWAVGQYRGQQDLPKWMIVSGLIAFLLASFFMAWRDERHAALDARATLDASQKPKLSGTIEGMVTGDVAETKTAQLFLLVSIRNAGAPSIAEAYKLKIKSRAFSGTVGPTVIREGPLYDRAGRLLVTLRKNEAIYEKTTTPIAFGAMARGWIRFEVEGVNSDELLMRAVNR